MVEPWFRYTARRYRRPKAHDGCLIVVVLCAIALAPALTSDCFAQEVPSIEELHNSLSEITPDYNMPIPLNLREPESDLAGVQLLGFDLSVDGKSTTGTPIVYQEGSTLQFTLFFSATAVSQAAHRIKVEVSGAGPTLSQGFQVPENKAPFGTVFKQDISFVHPAGRYSGKALLTISSMRDTEKRELYVAPVSVLPKARRSKLELKDLQKAFGKNIRRLNTALRLGPSSSITIDVRDYQAFQVHGLGIVSATGYDSNPRQKQAVCKVEFMSKDPTENQTFLLESGKTTAKADHDYYPKGALKTKKIEVFSSSDAPKPNAEGMPFKIHDYVGVFNSERKLKGKQLKFSYLLDEGMLSVNEIVLLGEPTH